MHLESRLREAFHAWLDQPEPYNQKVVEFENKQIDLEWLLVQLWHSTDILPAGYCDQLDIPKGSTYGGAVQELKQWLEKRRDSN